MYTHRWVRSVSDPSQQQKRQREFQTLNLAQNHLTVKPEKNNQQNLKSKDQKPRAETTDQ